MEEVWVTTASAIRECLKPEAVSVRGVAVVGHSDGLYSVDSRGTPVANAIQATDTRASARASAFQHSVDGERIARLTGTKPFPGSPAPICQWLLDNDPSVLSRARWLLFAKDWVRFRLTGLIATDPTDSSASFLDANTGVYSDEALDLFGLSEVAEMLPPIYPSSAPAGEVSRSASEVTGLREGVPVIIGCHDVDAAALGLGAVGAGELSIVAGTFSINQIITDEILIGDRWQVRPFVEAGKWLAMSTSPTSASNLDWFAQMAGTTDEREYATLMSEVEEIMDDPSEIIYIPYLYGAPDREARACFIGIGSHHSRGHMTRAVMEGVVFSHRLHLDWLAESYQLPSNVQLTGGASKSPTWMQMFSDGLDRDLLVGDGHDTARGGAMLAAVGTDQADTLSAAVSAMSCRKESYSPNYQRVTELDQLYRRFLELREAVL